MADLIPFSSFNNPEFAVRTTVDDDGTIWFVAKDVCDALGYAESSNPSRLIQSVPECWAGVKRFHITSDKPTARPYQDVLCLTEQGLYFFLGRSDKPKALPYQMWIAGDVVPSIRKHGGYLTPQMQDELVANPDLLIKLATALKDEREKAKALQEQAEKDKPKILFADAVDASSDSILIGNLAKLLRQNGVQIGQNRLFQWLRDNGYLISCKGERWNAPTQAALEKGLFTVKERVINKPDGSTQIVRTTKITGRGQLFFVNAFLNEVFPLLAQKGDE